MSMNPKVNDIQPNRITPVPYATSDAAVQPPLVSPTPIKDLAYGGNDEHTMSDSSTGWSAATRMLRRGILCQQCAHKRGDALCARPNKRINRC